MASPTASRLTAVAQRRRPNEAPALSLAGVWIIVPCYRVKDHIEGVLADVPGWIEGVVCVDDACPEGSGDFIERAVTDPRVRVLRLERNQGVGGAVMAGYAAAIDEGARVLVKVDGDGQMDQAYLDRLIAPILFGEADYAKGNRFTSQAHLQTMPRLRIFGNAVLSMVAKVSTGYWNVFDPTNGFTAIEASVAALLQGRRIDRRYFFETDMLYHLGTLRAVVRDVPMPAFYGDEQSNLAIRRILLPFAAKHVSNTVRRFIGQYFIRDFTVASLEALLGAALALFGLVYGLRWIHTPHQGPAPAGVVMAAALPIIVGVQLWLQALNFDVLSAPVTPVHPQLRAVERLSQLRSADV